MNKMIKLFVLMGFTLLLSDAALAEKLQLPPGMGGVPDIGTIPCDVFNKMITVGPLGTKRLLLTWAQGYYQAKSGKTIDEILEAAQEAGQSWDFDSLTGHLVDYCAADPEAPTSAAVIDLGEHLLNIAP
jgi:hypothetical protein